MPPNLDLSHAVWRKSSRSGANGACVEVAAFRDLIAVRDSKTPDGAVLMLDRDEWRSFVCAVKASGIDTSM
jgi:hypothetical protein